VKGTVAEPEPGLDPVMTIQETLEEAAQAQLEGAVMATESVAPAAK
jgi:hypothetical protein